jgi:hypothetical protein
MKNIWIIFLFIVFFIPSAYACGCGMAIANPTVFNALKETQAYLMIDVLDEDSYNEMPFFRMVSMDEPYDVTIVFPIDGVPYDVEGKTISAGEFLDDYNINTAEKHITKQSFSGLVNRVGKDLKEGSKATISLTNGFIGLFPFLFMGSFGSVESDMQFKNAETLGPMAHFEFEGGSLDIYDVDSMDTLEEFVETIDIELTGDVKELVTKYKDYYVAVLYLSVPSAINFELREQLKECPEQTENIKNELQEKTEFTYEEINDLTSGPCRESLYALINSVTDVNSNVNGTLVNMMFKGTNQFFYPTSIVNSYKYPITDEKYFIRAPIGLNVELESSIVDKKASFGSKRWYKVTSSEEDIKGKIVNAGFFVRAGDVLRKINEIFYNGSDWIVLIIYLLIIILPFVFYHSKVNESLTKGDIWWSVGIFILGGLFLTSLVMLIKRKKKFALTMFLLWLFLLIFGIILSFIP